MHSAALLHGWPGLLSAYSAVQAPLLVGLARSRAPLRRWLLSPLIAAPLTVLTGAAAAATAAPLAGLGLSAGNLLQVGAGVAISSALGYGVGRALGRSAGTAARQLRGAVIAPAPAPARTARASTERASRGITLAGQTIASEDEAKHFKLIGSTGTGKSTAIGEMLEAALARGDRAVIADPDGGYLKRFYDPARGDVILNPFDLRSARWDLFAELREDYDVEQLARSLIPDHEGPDRSWRGYARTFFSAVTAQARAAGTRDVSELYRLLVVAGTTELRTLVGGTPAQPFLEEHNGRMFDSIRSVTSSAVASLEYVARQKRPPFSVRDWVGAEAGGPGSGVLFMPYRAGQIAALRSTISAWMRLAIFEKLSQEDGGERLWFVVDELDALGQIDGLKDALARLRKFGGRCILGFQSLAQVSSTYGSHEAQTIVENCSTTLILRCSASEYGGTSAFASRLIGEREVTRISTSRSRRPTELWPSVTHAEHTSVESAVMGSEIEQLPDLSGYLKLASSPEWRRVRLRPAPRLASREASAGAKILNFPAERAAASAGPGSSGVSERTPRDDGLARE
jgi:type IV secretory pathway TraG/TraD family ATPase VirD4